ncbi:protein of unknown function (plasmid) [Cupriavidus taiwanensis]|uniref:Uncharacterized protein n=1 Tax=Cupriavidus taiwanensis TaxID=164546 RepID=A0A7Z7JAY4_9BURK|nr:protein of unknown function [Cupriavidus taiwanensis]SOZ11012.1 protein of unknown function [Cupriavidus taiwanensis]SOZ42337.1 protein of unknown function [Cupriavidus taiwanensis]SPC21374.1 protein of unknown function [Cupriavidus taiwanensis]SPD55515.1 protein of unknown function [Cupriavidus taiwanensis]
MRHRNTVRHGMFAITNKFATNLRRIIKVISSEKQDNSRRVRWPPHQRGLRQQCCDTCHIPVRMSSASLAFR